MRRKQRNKLHDRFKGWRCDSCGKIIRSVEGGWLEWLASEDKGGNDVLRGLRLVHRGHRKKVGDHCRYDPREEFRNGKTIVEGLALERIVGVDGLMVLLSLLAEGELPQREVLEIVKRVQIPGYELLRNISPKARHLNLLSPVLSHGYDLQSEIWGMIAEASQARSHCCANL